MFLHINIQWHDVAATETLMRNTTESFRCQLETVNHILVPTTAGIRELNWMEIIHFKTFISWSNTTFICDLRKCDFLINDMYYVELHFQFIFLFGWDKSSKIGNVFIILADFVEFNDISKYNVSIVSLQLPKWILYYFGCYIYEPNILIYFIGAIIILCFFLIFK